VAANANLDLGRRVEIVQHVTREFAHLETLERAKRWLIQAGIHASRIELFTRGVPRITVEVQPGEAAEVERVLDALATSDLEESPSFWDQARQQHVYPQQPDSEAPAVNPAHSESFVIGWRPQDPEREVSQESTDIERQKAFREGRD
jgi:hypothetical protein